MRHFGLSLFLKFHSSVHIFDCFIIHIMLDAISFVIFNKKKTNFKNVTIRIAFFYNYLLESIFDVFKYMTEGTEGKKKRKLVGWP